MDIDGRKKSPAENKKWWILRIEIAQWQVAWIEETGRPGSRNSYFGPNFLARDAHQDASIGSIINGNWFSHFALSSPYTTI